MAAELPSAPAPCQTLQRSDRTWEHRGLSPWPATLVAAPDQRSAARPENELGSRLRLVWWPASASTTPQGRLQSGSPPPADETTGAQSTMKLKRLALTLSCRALPAMLPGPACASVLGTCRVKGSLRSACGRP